MVGAGPFRHYSYCGLLAGLGLVRADACAGLALPAECRCLRSCAGRPHSVYHNVSDLRVDEQHTARLVRQRPRRFPHSPTPRYRPAACRGDGGTLRAVADRTPMVTVTQRGHDDQHDGLGPHLPSSRRHHTHGNTGSTTGHDPPPRPFRPPTPGSRLGGERTRRDSAAGADAADFGDESRAFTSGQVPQRPQSAVHRDR